MRTAPLAWARPGSISTRSAGSSKKTRLCAIGGALRTPSGTINDVAGVARLAHANGSAVFVDAGPLRPHVLVDVKALAPTSSRAHRTSSTGRTPGPLAARAPRRARRPGSSRQCRRTRWTGSRRTQNHEDRRPRRRRRLPGLTRGRAGERARTLVRTFAALHARGEALPRGCGRAFRDPRRDALRTASGSARTPTVGFAVDGHASEDVARARRERRLRLERRLTRRRSSRLGRGADGLVRAGAACYTTEDEVDRLVAGVAAIARA